MTRLSHRQGASHRGMGSGWKSAILATSVSAVLLGSMGLTRAESQQPSRRVDLQPPSAQVVIVPQQAGNLLPRLVTGPIIPQRPRFVQPITRTRRS